MRFEYEGHTHFLEFQRQYKDVPVVRRGVTKVERSKYPYTTARVLRASDEAGKKPTELFSSTVGCLTTDKFSNEAGRIAALRSLTSNLPLKLRVAVWQVYNDRRISK